MTTANSVAMPSRSGLLLRSGLALLAALAVLVLFVLPAEFGMDPTHFGRLTGLTRLSQTAKPSTALNTTASHTYKGTFRTDEVDLTLIPGESYEYKVRMKPEGALLYSWSSSVPLEYDFHGEADKDPDNAVSYNAGSGGAQHGSLIAPFHGIHGWYWENKNTKEPADIHIKMAGQYELTVDFSQ